MLYEIIVLSDCMLGRYKSSYDSLMHKHKYMCVYIYKMQL